MTKLQQVQKIAKQLRLKNKKLTQPQAVKLAWQQVKKKVGATLILEKKETKNTKPKKVVRVTRSSGGAFESFKKVGTVNFTPVKDLFYSIKLHNRIVPVKYSGFRNGKYIFYGFEMGNKNKIKRITYSYTPEQYTNLNFVF